MKNIYVGLLAAVACTYSMQAAANSLNCNNLNLVFKGDDFSLTAPFASHTAIPIGLKPISSLDNAVKLAAVCSVGGGGCSELGFGKSDKSMNLDKNFQCTDEGFVKTCPSGYVKDDNNLCPHNKSYFKCRPCNSSCDSGYSLTSCNSTTQVQTASYKTECGSTCYQCRDKTCAEGGYSASLTSCQNGTAVSFANKTCYKNVTAKTCENGGYKSSIPTNNKCDSTTYCNKTCYTNCKQPTCEDGGYKSAVPTNNVCTDVTYYGRTCKTNCKQPTCEDGGYKSGVPTNQVCTPVSYYGRSCYQNCYQPQCSAGGYKDSIPTNNKCTAVTYYGRNCYKDCKQPTCSDGGYKDAVPANQVCTPVSYYGRSCYQNCYQPQCSAGGYKDSVPTNNECTTVTYYGRTCYKDCYEKQICEIENCSDYNLASCPNHANCSSCTQKTADCTTGKTLYKMNGCYNGYTPKTVPSAGTVCASKCIGGQGFDTIQDATAFAVQESNKGRKCSIETGCAPDHGYYYYTACTD